MSKVKPIKYPCPVRRVRLAWRNEKWVVVKSVRVRSMTLPRSLELSDSQRENNAYFKVMDNKGKVVVNLPAPASARPVTELFERDGTITSHHLEGMEQTVELLFPDQKTIKELIYHAPRKKGGHKYQPKVQSISLDEITKREK